MTSPKSCYTLHTMDQGLPFLGCYRPLPDQTALNAAVKHALISDKRDKLLALWWDEQGNPCLARNALRVALEALQPKVVVELWTGNVASGLLRFGWLIVRDGETRIAFKREHRTVFDAVTPEQVAQWHADLGSPEHVKLVVREARDS